MTTEERNRRTLHGHWNFKPSDQGKDEVLQGHCGFGNPIKAVGKIIIAIVGDSGAGKTTFAKYLTNTRGWKDIVSYTTRPMRECEVYGVDHWFVKDSSDLLTRPILAWTKYGGYDYWVRLEDVNNPDIQTYVIDEKGLLELEEKWGDDIHIFAIYIRRPNNPTDAFRTNRDKHRITIQDEGYDLIINNNYGSAAEFCMMGGLEFQVAFDKYLLKLLDEENGKNEKN